MKGFTYCAASGSLAATASLFGKLSMSSEETTTFVETLGRRFLWLPFLGDFSQEVVFATRVSLFALMVLTNALMWTTFTKALNCSRTTLEATITNTAFNFILTAFYGIVCFGESVSLLWWLGSAMVLTGLLLMTKADPHSMEEKEYQSQSSPKIKDS